MMFLKIASNVFLILANFISFLKLKRETISLIAFAAN